MQRCRLIVLMALLIPFLSYGREQEPSNQDLVVHGTINIAFGNKNGLVVLTDSMVTSGDRQLAEPAQKLFKLDDQTVCAIAGFGWALSPSVPDLNTSSAAIIYEYARQTAAQQPQKFAEKLRTLAWLFQLHLSMIGNVLDATGHPLPADNYRFQLILAGYDLDGKPRIGRVSLQSSNLQEGRILDVKEDLIYQVSGMPDVATALLLHPEGKPGDPVLSEYADSRQDNGRSLTVEQMAALAQRLAFYTSQRHREVGGPNQIAIITAPHRMKIVQKQFPPPPKPISGFSLVVGSGFAYSSVAFKAPHNIFVRTSWAGMKQEIGENFFIGNTFENCILTYHAGSVNLGDTNRITNSVLLVNPLIRPKDETVLRLSKAFQWKAILRDFPSGPAPFY